MQTCVEDIAESNSHRPASTDPENRSASPRVHPCAVATQACCPAISRPNPRRSLKAIAHALYDRILDVPNPRPYTPPKPDLAGHKEMLNRRPISGALSLTHYDVCHPQLLTFPTISPTKS